MYIDMTTLAVGLWLVGFFASPRHALISTATSLIVGLILYVAWIGFLFAAAAVLDQVATKPAIVATAAPRTDPLTFSARWSFQEVRR
jgi:hypothetical protein